jgi:LysR family transcriptional activator of mexEF-oprN operon
MNSSYGRDLDLNLLRVFVVVAECRSVTKAAAQLYLTQPAVSAALRRLTAAVGAPLFVRDGRGIALTERGEQLFQTTLPHLRALVEGALEPQRFDPLTSERVIRIGLADISEATLLPRLLHALAKKAPRMRIVSLPVQFRSVGPALASRSVDMAVTVADELPDNIRRKPLFSGDFVCLYDPRHVRFKRLTEAAYFAHEHVIVSYNGDLRGIVEDMFRKTRRVRCSVASFAYVGDIVSGTALIATVPRTVGERACRLHRSLRIAEKPFALDGATIDLLWPAATDDDPACRFVREELSRAASS